MVFIFNNIDKDKSNLIKLDKDDFISLMILKDEKVYETTLSLSGGAVLIYRVSLTLLQQVINYSVNVSFYTYSYCQRNLLYITIVRYNRGIA